MSRFQRVLLACALFGVVAASAHAADPPKRIKYVAEIPWLKTNVAAVAQPSARYDSRRSIGQSTADTSAWFSIPGITWGPGVDLIADMVGINGAITSPDIATLIKGDTTGVVGWIAFASDSSASSTVTSCSLYVETAGPDGQLVQFSEADAAGKHRWFGVAFNPTDNLPAYQAPLTLTAATWSQAPWLKGHTRMRVILVPVGNMRKTRLSFGYWTNDSYK